MPVAEGEKEAEQASNAAINTFSKLQNDDALPNKTILEAKISIIDALKVLDFVKSNGEARRLIRGNGARVNDIIINDEHFVLSNDHFKDYRAKISSGKKKLFMKLD